jgi:protein-S-isoprenylcysteine O-methyltransferase Ste14
MADRPTSNEDAANADPASDSNSAPTGYAPPSHFPWPPVLFLSTAVAGWLLQRAWPLAWPGLDDAPARIIGKGFIVCGFGLGIWALVTMIRNSAEFRPHAEATVLVTSGPFRRFRNPMYLGYALILLGLADAAHNIWIAILTPVFAIAVTYLAIIPEERHLDAKFGDAYRTYKENSRRWL